MSEYDLANLRFLITISKESFDRWLASASNDDVEYALELLENHRALSVQFRDDVKDVSEAKRMLTKFALNPNPPTV
jgi:DnaJ-domain-containing protein 1